MFTTKYLSKHTVIHAIQLWSGRHIYTSRLCSAYIQCPRLQVSGCMGFVSLLGLFCYSPCCHVHINQISDCKLDGKNQMLSKDVCVVLIQTHLPGTEIKHERLTALITPVDIKVVCHHKYSMVPLCFDWNPFCSQQLCSIVVCSFIYLLPYFCSSCGPL